jgi:hypothetical protein
VKNLCFFRDGQGVYVTTAAPTIKYAISYKLNGERRFEFALLQSPSAEEALAALQKMHGDSTDVISDVKVSKAL